jgi:hypothetical protein
VRRLTITCPHCRQGITLRVGARATCRLVSDGKLAGTLTAISDDGEVATAMFPGCPRPVTCPVTLFIPVARSPR